MSFKRHRAQSETSSSSSTTSAASPTIKVQRTTPEASSSTVHPLLCTLPPTCNHKPTPIANSKDLEAHYATYHAHVCEEPSCNCVFPDARLLELHQTECHDPLAALRKDRGEKIFACHLASCNKVFLTPKARRLHLIQGHNYPKEYFFAVTNKGVGELLRRWGEGASLIRGPWKSREPEAPASTERQSSVLVEEDDEEEPEDAVDSRTPHAHSHPLPPATDGVDSLTDSLHALSLVPPAIRFGRGGKNGGFSNNRRSHRGRGGPGSDGDVMDVDVVPRGRGDGLQPVRGRGEGLGGDPDVLAYVPRGARGRGRGLIVQGALRR